ncbi:uncharacterized protein LOC123446506 [Hordeum vulgare subsp. vulgare]|uniref:Predicted protein n=1 Tax=Hordeum vulgare subsp. vulgare TaxID=112509 RepID=F2CW60_HORVV|nr:uncharacterized protein LOC123446506 [Hordeum vulgare subsp. vulgare]BAJ87081.1 predicted protein [Hordeum vulgare subsp. vulgare]
MLCPASRARPCSAPTRGPARVACSPCSAPARAPALSMLRARAPSQPVLRLPCSAPVLRPCRCSASPAPRSCSAPCPVLHVPCITEEGAGGGGHGRMQDRRLAELRRLRLLMCR